MTKSVSLTIDDKSIELPVVVGSEAEKALDISQLRSSTGYITLDQGYGNTGSCQSAITYIDGDAGILRYRGIPIEQFEDSPNFIEVCWLLIFGTLPTSDPSCNAQRVNEASFSRVSGNGAANGNPVGHDQRIVVLSPRYDRNGR